MRHITPIEAALELIDTLEGKEDLTHLEEWLLRGFKLYRAGEAKTLDKALGLAVGPGQARDRLCYKWRHSERNQLIREAAQHLIAEHGKVPAAKIIADAMNNGVKSLGGPETWNVQVILVRLRTLAMKQQDDHIKFQRVVQIIDGDGA